MTTSIYGDLTPSDESNEQRIVQSLKNYNRVFFKITGLVLISVSCVSCAISLTLVIYLDDKTNRFRQIFGYTYSVLLLILNILSVFALIQRKVKLIYPTMLATLIIAFVVALLMCVLQISKDILQKNGTGKIPLIDPHTQFWYQIDSAFTILTYVIAVLVILQEIIVYMYIRPSKRQDKVDNSLIQSQQSLLIFENVQESDELRKSLFQEDQDHFYSYQKKNKEERFQKMPEIPETITYTNPEQIVSEHIENEIVANSFNQMILQNTIPSKKQKAIDLLQNPSVSFSINTDRYQNQSYLQQFTQNQ